MKRLAELTPEEIEILEAAGKSIVEQLTDVPLEVEGAPKTSVRYKDGGYKMRPILAGWNFFMDSAYLGKRGEVIFVLSPEDAQEYEFAEFSCKALDTVFPLAGSQLAEKLGLETESFEVLFGATVEAIRDEREQEKQLARNAYKDDPTFGMF